MVTQWFPLHSREAISNLLIARMAWVEEPYIDDTLGWGVHRGYLLASSFFLFMVYWRTSWIVPHFFCLTKLQKFLQKISLINEDMPYILKKIWGKLQKVGCFTFRFFLHFLILLASFNTIWSYILKSLNFSLSLL